MKFDSKSVKIFVMKMLLNIIKLLHILLFHNNFLKIYKILLKNQINYLKIVWDPD